MAMNVIAEDRDIATASAMGDISHGGLLPQSAQRLGIRRVLKTRRAWWSGVRPSDMPKMYEVLVSIALDPQARTADRIAAASQVLDRTIGKAQPQEEDKDTQAARVNLFLASVINLNGQSANTPLQDKGNYPATSGPAGALPAPGGFASPALEKVFTSHTLPSHNPSPSAISTSPQGLLSMCVPVASTVVSAGGDSAPAVRRKSNSARVGKGCPRGKDWHASGHKEQLERLKVEQGTDRPRIGGVGPRRHVGVIHAAVAPDLGDPTGAKTRPPVDHPGWTPVEIEPPPFEPNRFSISADGRAIKQRFWVKSMTMFTLSKTPKFRVVYADWRPGEKSWTSKGATHWMPLRWKVKAVGSDGAVQAGSKQPLSSVSALGSGEASLG